MIQEKALNFAKSLKKDGFKASSGCLNMFRTCHRISHAVICGESGCVDEKVVENWKSCLPDITAGTECKGGKRLKERITAMFENYSSKTKAVVIGKCMHIYVLSS